MREYYEEEISLQAIPTADSIIEQSVKFDQVKEIDSLTNMQSFIVSIKPDMLFYYATEAKLGHHATTVIKRKLAAGILYVGLIAGLIAGFVTGLIAGLVVGKNINQMIIGGLAGAIIGIVTVNVHNIICIKGGIDISISFCISSARFLAVRLFVVVLVPSVVTIFDNINSEAAMGATGGAFIGSLIARASNKNVSSIAKPTVFAITLGALIGMIVGIASETLFGTIMGAIIAGTVTMAFDKLEAFITTVFTTGILGEILTTVPGIITVDDFKAAITGMCIGAFMRTSAGTFILGVVINHITEITIGNTIEHQAVYVDSGVVVGAVATAIIVRARFGAINDYLDFKKPNAIQSFTFISIVFAYVSFRYISKVFGEGICGIVGGIFLAAAGCIGVIATESDNSVIKLSDRASFAALAAMFGSVFPWMFCKPLSGAFALEMARIIPEILTRLLLLIKSTTVATIGAGIGGYFFAIAVNMVGERLVVGTVVRLVNQAVQIIAAIGEASKPYVIICYRGIDQAVVLGAIGATPGVFGGALVDGIIGDRLAGATSGAVWGAISGVIGAAVAIPIIVIMTLSSTQEIKTIIVITTIGGFIGGFAGGQFTTNMMAGTMIGLTITMAIATILTTVLHIARRSCIVQVPGIPIIDIVNTFGVMLDPYDNEDEKDLSITNNWIRYEIVKNI